MASTAAADGEEDLRDIPLTRKLLADESSGDGDTDSLAQWECRRSSAVIDGMEVVDDVRRQRSVGNRYLFFLTLCAGG